MRSICKSSNRPTAAAFVRLHAHVIMRRRHLVTRHLVPTGTSRHSCDIANGKNSDDVSDLGRTCQYATKTVTVSPAPTCGADSRIAVAARSGTQSGTKEDDESGAQTSDTRRRSRRYAVTESAIMPVRVKLPESDKK